MTRNILMLGVVATVVSAQTVRAATFTSIYSFSGLADGGVPTGGVASDKDGNIYGFTSTGGASGQGTIFEVTAAGQFVTLLSLNGSPNGSAPQGSPIVVGSELYGTTSAGGGTGGRGTLFSFSLSSRKLKVLHLFTGTDGATPKGALWLDSNKNIVGTTYGGGANGLGTVYSFSTTSSQYSLLHSFQGGASDGANPAAGVIEDSLGNIYGTTFFGGIDSIGTLYKITSAGESVLFSIGSDNCCGLSMAEPAIDSSGNFYLPVRGAIYQGALELVTPSGSAQPISSLGLNSANAINNPDGQGIEGTPVIVGSTLYITCAVGGQFDYGTIASVALASGYPTTVIHSFGPSDGYNPSGKLAQTKSGVFYGTTSSGGANGYGTVFSFRP